MRKKMFGAYGSPRSNLTNVEALRAIAALAVVLVHLRVFLQMLRIPNIGGGGVDLFFVISGYLMVYTTRRSTPRPFEFFARRLARIAPMYWLVTCTPCSSPVLQG
jgi:peptidoglycan/LPS O-acetylase OafA/YrhL